tara:strand:- start:58 stop:831 length:774 start_codon:yes stop_codon:yes gene_type:complete
MIIDSHCHLLHKNNSELLTNIVKNAFENNVFKLLNISTKHDEFDSLIKISNNNKHIFCSLGIHPHESHSMSDKIKTTIKDLSKNKKVIGIGETGLDFFYDHSDRDTQINSFIKHIEISQELQLPLIVHMREAEEDMLKIIKKYYLQKEFSGVIHCFTGSYEFMKSMLPYNFYFSISGIVTFKNSHELRETIKKIPLDKILVETDSPYLAPVPMRGKVNEPAYLIHTVDYVSKMFNLSYKEFSDITTNNFFNLFQKAG